MVHSVDLCWAMVGRNNRFVQRRNGIRLSNDPFNNSGKATKRHAGFLQNKAAVVKVKGEKELYITVKDGNKFSKKVLAGAKPSVVAKAVGEVRPDLVDVAFRRARRLSSVIKNIAAIKADRKKRLAKREQQGLKAKRKNNKNRKSPKK
jgi:large subunit ribosomal protein L28e